MWLGLRKQLATPVSGQSLGFFRFSFGAVMLLFCLRMLFTYGGVPWYQLFFAPGPDFYTFRYSGFEWVHPISRGWFSLLVNVLCISCLLVAVGLAYRFACVVMFVTWTYVFLLERSYYNNHYYLMSLIAFLLIFMPANASWSMDRWLRSQPGEPQPRVLIPFWPIFLLRAQLFLVYLFAGITKLNAEWLVSAAPLRVFLSNPMILEPYRAYLTPGTYAWLESTLHAEWFAYFLTYTGTIYDLAVGFMLLFRRTRLFAFALTVIFHGMNHFLLFDDIDVFPLMAVAATTIFLDPDWPRRVSFWIRRRQFRKPDWAWLIGGAIAFPVIGALLGWKIPPTRQPERQIRPLSAVITALIVLWIAIQAVVPLRHYLIPGDVNWTQEGELFSWRVKAAVRDHRTTRFAVIDPELLNVDQQGKLEVAWETLELEPKVFVDVDPKRVAWQELPPIVAIYEPLTGERLLFNPWFGGRTAPRSAEEGTRWIEEHWQKELGRLPDAIEPCTSAKETVDQILPLIDEKQFGKILGESIETAARSAQMLETGSLSPKETKHTVGRLRNIISAFAGIGTIQDQVQAHLKRAEPFVLSGAPANGGAFLHIVDEALLNKEKQTLNANALVKVGKAAGPLEILFALDTLSMLDLKRFPRVFVVRDQLRGTYLFWNPCHDAMLYQVRRLMSGPLPCQEYAVHIADWWERRYGRRPEVYVEMWMSLHDHPEQLAIDPDVDLARVRGLWFTHNPWIYQLGSEEAARRAEETSPP